jgi:DNA-binding NarL/FixJ family response regulator
MSSSEAPNLRVVVAEDHYLVREAIVRLVGQEPGIELVATCDDFDAAAAALEQLRPDVLVSDIRMPPSGVDEGIRLAELARDQGLAGGVVVLSQYLEPALVLRLLGGGSAGRAYLLKDRITHHNQLVTAIETVAEGGSVVDPLVVDELVSSRDRADGSPLNELTPRELEVLGLVAQGRSNAAIAAELYLTKRSVEKYINGIFVKLDLPDDQDVSRRVAATLVFLGRGS